MEVKGNPGGRPADASKAPTGLDLPSHDQRERFPSLYLLLIFLALTAIIVAAGYFFYSRFEQNFRAAVELQLSSIAELKVGQLVQWRKERMGDASIFYKNKVFSGLVRRFLEKPADAEARGLILNWLGRVQGASRCDRIFILDAQGIERMAVPGTPEPVASHLLQQIPEILRSNKITFLDFHRDTPDRPIHLSLVVPVREESDGGRPLGVLVLRIDPATYLYPFIKQWPVPSRTAETLLIRRDGNDALFLNDLKFQKDSALKLRVPLTSTDMPAVKAATGQEGTVEGNDYRGVQVLADVRGVPDSPWFLVARMDVTEVNAPLREWLWLIIGLVAALLFGAGAGVGLIWRRQRLRFFRERLAAAKALRKSESLYRLLADHMTETVWVMDMNFKMTYISPSVKKLRGYTLEELQQLTFDQNLTPASFQLAMEAFSAEMPKVMSDPTYSFTRALELEFYRKDGTTFWSENTFSLIRDENGNPASILGEGRDITERKKAEEALRESERVLRKHERALRERNDELIRFNYAVSHDLKSPLVTIQTFLGYLEQDIRKPDAAGVDKDLEYIRTASRKMSFLLDELLELSRVGRRMNPPVEAPLQAIVKEALDLVAGRIAKRGVKVKVTKKPILLCGDQPRLVEVFQNLIDNAVKFMGDQPAPLVEIGAEQADDEIVLFVRDNGIGIDQRHQSKLFGLFEKLDPGSEGTGIGLALVKRIVEVHGGKIWVESEGPGQGAMFRFTLAKTKRL